MLATQEFVREKISKYKKEFQATFVDSFQREILSINNPFQRALYAIGAEFVEQLLLSDPIAMFDPDRARDARSIDGKLVADERIAKLEKAMKVLREIERMSHA